VQGSAALRKDTHTNEAFADLDSGLRFGKQFAINMQYNARRYMMNTIADPIKNDILAVVLGYPKDEVGSSSALWVAEQMRARRDYYTQEVRTQAVVCTYNVGLATPCKEMASSLRPLLRPHGVVDAAAEHSEGKSRKETRLFCDAIYLYKRSFYQDRLGTNIGGAQKRTRFCRS
jgi:hypothetical protein